MGDIKHKKFDMNLGSRPSHARLRHNWNLMSASRVPQDVPFTNSERRAPTQQHDGVSGGQGGESGRIVQMSHIDSTLDWRNPLPSLFLSLYLSFPPTISDRRCASPSLKAMPLSSWGNRNGAISFRLALAHLCLLLSSCFQASKSSKLKKRGKKRTKEKKIKINKLINTHWKESETRAAEEAVRSH